MSNKLQIQLPNPCHEDWNKMSPVEQGRFCNSCQKAVVDFTGMSDAQLVAFFKKPSTGSVCGRFNGDQLERELAIPGKRMPWLRYFLQLLIPAFLISSKAKSQGRPVLANDTVMVDSVRSLLAAGNCVAKKNANERNTITGQLVDDKGLAIPFGSVIIKGTNRGAACNKEGIFSLRTFGDNPKITLVFSSVGFEVKEITIDSNMTQTSCNVGLVPLKNEMSTGIVIVGWVAKKKKKPVTIFQRVLKDTAAKFFKIYPNPVQCGELIKLELKDAEHGEYIADLLGQNGQIVHSSTLQLDNDLSNIYAVPSTITGVYFLRLTNKLSGKKYVEKVIIQ